MIPTDDIHKELDLENDSASPVFDRFYANGGLQMIEMCNIDYNKFEHLWHGCHTVLTKKIPTG